MPNCKIPFRVAFAIDVDKLLLSYVMYKILPLLRYVSKNNVEAMQKLQRMRFNVETRDLVRK